MNPIPAATARLQGAADRGEILSAACEAFELMLRVIEGLQDPSGGAFADFVIASTYAANGRDVLLFAPALPAVSGNRASVAESESALETVVEAPPALRRHCRPAGRRCGGRSQSGRLRGLRHREAAGDPARIVARRTHRPVTDRATFGDFAGLASSQFARALSLTESPVTRTSHVAEFRRGLSQVISIMERYLDHATARPPGRQGPAGSCQTSGGEQSGTRDRISRWPESSSTAIATQPSPLATGAQQAQSANASTPPSPPWSQAPTCSRPT